MYFDLNEDVYALKTLNCVQPCPDIPPLQLFSRKVPSNGQAKIRLAFSRPCGHATPRIGILMCIGKANFPRTDQTLNTKQMNSNFHWRPNFGMAREWPKPNTRPH